MPEYAVFVVGAIYPALPRNVVVGPIWLLPTVIVVNVKNAASSVALICDRINSCWSFCAGKSIDGASALATENKL